MSNFPWWVTDTDPCIWCRKEARLFNACVNDDQNGVEMYYVCDNPKCEHVMWFKKPYKLCIVQYGKTAVEVFNKKMALPDVQYGKVPEETVI